MHLGAGKYAGTVICTLMLGVVSMALKTLGLVLGMEWKHMHRLLEHAGACWSVALQLTGQTDGAHICCHLG